MAMSSDAILTVLSHQEVSFGKELTGLLQTLLWHWAVCTIRQGYLFILIINYNSNLHLAFYSWGPLIKASVGSNNWPRLNFRSAQTCCWCSLHVHLCHCHVPWMYRHQVHSCHFCMHLHLMHLHQVFIHQLCVHLYLVHLHHVTLCHVHQFKSHRHR